MRLTLRNVSAKPVLIPSISPMVVIRLRVYDSAGHQVKPGPLGSAAIVSGPDRRQAFDLSSARTSQIEGPLGIG